MEESLVVTIAGCGALGSLFAARLIEGGLEVQAFQRKGAQQKALKERGITVEADKGRARKTFRLAAVSDHASDLRLSRLIIVMVKSHSTEGVSPVREVLAPDGVVLTLQNGLGNPEVLAVAFGEERVAAGAAMYGANAVAPGVVRLAGDGYIEIGPWKRWLDMRWMGEVLTSGGLNVRYAEDPRPAIWKKLWLNAIVNPTAALTGMTNGELLDNPVALDLMSKLGREAVVAAERAGVTLNFDVLWTRCLETLEWSAPTVPSMLQDVQAGRKTEIESISGGVLGYARGESEFPHTRSVYSLVKAIDINNGFQ